MMTKMRTIWIVLAPCFLATVSSPARGQDWVAAAKRVSVASLDSTLRAIPLERWLVELAGRPASSITWEVNDCGEGGDGRQSPICVEAVLTLGADSTAHLSLAVADVHGKPLPRPGIWDLSVGAGYKFTGFRTLHEWAAGVRSAFR